MMHQATTNTKVWVEGQVNGQGIFGVRPLTVTFNFNNCGKILFSSYHTASTGYGNPYGPTPGLPLSQRCSQQPLSPQERILEYLIFDIANCVRPIQ